MACATEGEEEDTILAYVDENNLYGSALCQYLPHSEFEWVGDSGHEDPEGAGNLNTNAGLLKWLNDASHIQSIAPDAEYGFLLEVDLDYPPEIHDRTSDYPLAPEQGAIGSDQFSPFMVQIYKELNQTTNMKTFTPVSKLLLTQTDKKAYVVHYRILQFYLEMGMRLVSVRRAIRFRQKEYLRPYLEYNSRKRQSAKNSFEKDFYKLKNNSLFGKTMEDVRKRIDYRLKTRPEDVAKAVNSPLFYDREIISENLVGLHMLKPQVELNKPIYIGQAVLDYSKLEMYNLFYKTINLPGPLIADVKLLAGDTDSFFMEIRVKKVQAAIDEQISGLSSRDKVFAQWRNLLDSSNYPPKHPLFSDLNKARLLCFKDETAGREVNEMVFLRPKMYSLQFAASDSTIKRAKGIGRPQVAALAHADYRAAFENAVVTSTTMVTFRSENHQVRTVTIKKRALSAWEDKRYWISANESLPYGHYKTVASAAPPPPLSDTDN